MGTGAELYVPMIISALGVGAQAVNQHQQASRQEDISNQMIRSQQSRQHEADAALNQNLDALGRSTGEQERQASLEGFLQQLRANAGASSGGGAPSEASDRARADAASGSAAIQNYGTNRAGVLSRIMGPTLQRTNEQAMTNRTGDTVRGIQRDAGGDAWLAQLRSAQNVQDPWLNAAGQLAQSYGGAMAGNAGAMNPTDELAWKRNLSINQGYTPPKIDLGRQVWG